MVSPCGVHIAIAVLSMRRVGARELGGRHEETRDGEDTKQSSTEQKPVDGSAELCATVLPFCRHIVNFWALVWKSMFSFVGKISCHALGGCKGKIIQFAAAHGGVTFLLAGVGITLWVGVLFIMGIRLLIKDVALVSSEAHAIDYKDVQSPCQQYTSYNDHPEFDFSIGVTKEGAFGFKWGERPLSEEYKPPCEVKYYITTMLYSEVKLRYDKEGLGMITFCGYEFGGLPVPADLPKFCQRRILREQIESVFPIFQAMYQVAEIATNQEIVWFKKEDALNRCLAGRR